MTGTNEMINLPMVSVAPVGDVTPSSEYETASSMSIAAPTSNPAPECISVWADSITPSSCVSDTVAAFDVVFSVGILSDDKMTSKTYRIVKRIGIDKSKIAAEAESSAPVSIVESKAAELKEEAEATRKRFRRLAGLE